MSSDEDASVELVIEEGVAILTLARPDTLNAISCVMVGELLSKLDYIEGKDARVRCLLLTGRGRAFCAGADLRPGKSGVVNAQYPDAGYDLEHFYNPLLRRLRGLCIPIVTAVNGAAAGAGVSLALMGDLILCARSAYFLQAFRHVGLVPDAGATWLLPRLIGRARALELSLLGERLDAETALQWGLINRVFDSPDLMPEAMTMARGLADGPTVALGLTRRLYWESEGNSHEEQIDLERGSQRIAGRSEDFREGILAFQEKRKAQFKGL